MEPYTRSSALSDEGGRDVLRARDGDAEAFGRVYTELRPKVRGAAYRVIGDEHEAEDTAQDAFLSAYECLPRLADTSAFEAWLMRITRNRAVDRRRNMLKCRPSERAHDENMDHSPNAARVVHRSGVAEPTAESVAALRASLAELPVPMRRVLRDRYLRGRSYEEIARADGVSVPAVKTRLFRARRRLREALLPEETAGRPVSRGEHAADGEKTCVSPARR